MISQTYFSPSGEHFDLSTRGSRGVKQKGSRRWKGSEKVVINEETMGGGGWKGVRQRRWVIIWWKHDAQVQTFFSALVNWLRNILIDIRPFRTSGHSRGRSKEKTNHSGGNIIMGWLIPLRKGIVDASWQLTCWYLLTMQKELLDIPELWTQGLLSPLRFIRQQ